MKPKPFILKDKEIESSLSVSPASSLDLSKLGTRSAESPEDRMRRTVQRIQQVLTEEGMEMVTSIQFFPTGSHPEAPIREVRE